MTEKKLTPPWLEQLRQLKTITWDGNLISKADRDELFKRGLIDRAHGWQWLTRAGVDELIKQGDLRP